DPAKIHQRCTIADVYLVKDKSNKIQQIILPVFGEGAKSMMYAFLALDPDGRTVKNLYYYQQRETPFLGARVEDESWRKQWPGKKVVDNNLMPALRITQEKPENIDEYTVDGISGATLTSNGVERSINYWTGEQGYGRFLQRITRGPDIIVP
ncbi:Na+-translocating NADH-quinone reductase subunit C, partial [Citrobacter freundii]